LSLPCLARRLSPGWLTPDIFDMLLTCFCRQGGGCCSVSAGVRLATSQTATTPAWDIVKSLTYSMKLTFATRCREIVQSDGGLSSASSRLEEM
jgi:hypothetical protein